MKKEIVRYEIEMGGKWVRVTKGAPTSKGWLHYELKEGDSLTNGLCRPGKWREAVKK